MFKSFEGVGLRIQELLDNLGVKQADVVRETGISKNALSNYVNGNRIPDNKALYALSKFFNVSMEWILTGKNIYSEDNKSLKSPELRVLLSSEELELLSLYRKLTDDARLEIRLCTRIKNEIMNKESGKGLLSTYVNGEDAAAKMNV